MCSQENFDSLPDFLDNLDDLDFLLQSGNNDFALTSATFNSGNVYVYQQPQYPSSSFGSEFDFPALPQVPNRPQISSPASSDSQGNLSPQPHEYYYHSPPDSSSDESTWVPGNIARPFARPVQRTAKSRQFVIEVTEEERQLLLAENVDVPSNTPLSREDEKRVKLARRRIKNKLSAQDSRCRKREHVKHLELQVEETTRINMNLQEKVDLLEQSNKSLLQQLRDLQRMVAEKSGGAKVAGAGTCVMLLALSFSLFFSPVPRTGGANPSLPGDFQKYQFPNSDRPNGAFQSPYLPSMLKDFLSSNPSRFGSNESEELSSISELEETEPQDGRCSSSDPSCRSRKPVTVMN